MAQADNKTSCITYIRVKSTRKSKNNATITEEPVLDNFSTICSFFGKVRLRFKNSWNKGWKHVDIGLISFINPLQTM